MEDEFSDEISKEISSNDCDGAIAVESYDEYEEDGLSSSSSSSSSHKDDDQFSNGDNKYGSTSRIIQVSDDQLGRFASDELKLKQIRHQDGTPCWKMKGKVICDGQNALRRYCMDNRAECLSEYLEAHEQVTIFEIRSI